MKSLFIFSSIFLSLSILNAFYDHLIPDRTLDANDPIMLEDMEAVKKLFKNKDVNQKTRYKDSYIAETPLYRAASTGNPELINFFLKKGARVNEAMNVDAYFDLTALYAAVDSREPKAIKLLLENGADPNIKDSDGSTLFHYVVSRFHPQVIKEFLKHGANPNIQDKEGNTVLHIAAEIQDFDIMKILISQGANPNIRNKYGENMRDVFIKDKSFVLTYIVFSNYNDPYSLEEKKIMLEELEEIRHKRLSLNYRTQDGKTALYFALLENRIDKAKALLQDGAQINEKNYKEEIALYSIFTEKMENKIEVLKFLIKNGMDINEKNRSGESLLHLVIKRSEAQLARLLIDQGADPYAKNNEGKTPMDFMKNSSLSFLEKVQIKKAVKNNRPRIIKLKPLTLMQRLGKKVRR